MATWLDDPETPLFERSCASLYNARLLAAYKQCTCSWQISKYKILSFLKFAFKPFDLYTTTVLSSGRNWNLTLLFPQCTHDELLFTGYGRDIELNSVLGNDTFWLVISRWISPRKRRNRWRLKSEINFEFSSSNGPPRSNIWIYTLCHEVVCACIISFDAQTKPESATPLSKAVARLPRIDLTDSPTWEGEAWPKPWTICWPWYNPLQLCVPNDFVWQCEALVPQAWNTE